MTCCTISRNKVVTQKSYERRTEGQQAEYNERKNRIDTSNYWQTKLGEQRIISSILERSIAIMKKMRIKRHRTILKLATSLIIRRKREADYIKRRENKALIL